MLLVPDWAALALAICLGLMAGSFVNVVVHRLPIMLSRQWRTEALATLAVEPPQKPRFNLALPRSRCPSCEQTIKARDNIPVASWLFLQGRCRHCAAAISVRYPVVELLGAIFAVASIQVWGPSALAICYFALLMALLALALIDFETLLLPDQITLPLLWLGLAAAVAFDATPTPTAALIGAIAGYGTLWLFYWGHRLLTRREGMGYGDFKLLAALGAWLGWRSVLAILLIACITGIAYASFGLLRRRTTRTTPIPFGPFLCLGGAATLFFSALADVSPIAAAIE